MKIVRRINTPDRRAIYIKTVFPIARNSDFDRQNDYHKTQAQIQQYRSPKCVLFSSKTAFWAIENAIMFF